MGFRTQTHQHHLLSLLLLHLLKHRPSLRLFQKDATLLISRIVFPLPLVQVINSAIKYGCPTEPRITALLWEENVLPTRLVAVDQPNVLVAAAMLLAFHRPTLHPSYTVTNFSSVHFL